jgi:Flp pilus assembly protein TadG
MSVSLQAVRDKSGSAAIEFALVAPVFFALMFSIFEVGWFYFVNSQVDAATLRAARLVKTGQAQEQNLDKTGFFNATCPPLAVFGDCATNVTVEVQTFSSFAALVADKSPAICRDDDPSIVNAIPYNPGADAAIVRLRVCLLYKTINPVIGINLSDSQNGVRHVVGSYLFRNEPYSRGAN